MQLFVLGASGRVGTCLLEQAVARGHSITAQTRSAGKLAGSTSVNVIIGSPTDEAFLRQHIVGHDAVVLCIGIDSAGETTLFSETTRAVIAAMRTANVRRLVAITGVGAGNTKGHGGWFYNHIIYPLFTRHRYADKDRQEAVIEQTDLDWTIVRPAPFTTKTDADPLEVWADVPAGLQLRSITPTEVATFILDSLESGGFIRQKPFIGHS